MDACRIAEVTGTVVPTGEPQNLLPVGNYSFANHRLQIVEINHKS
jgi:hypothetical protein